MPRAAALLTGLAVALLPTTAAAAAPAWRSAERMQAALFDAQTALLLERPATAADAAERGVRAAARGFRGPLAAGLRSAAAGRGAVPAGQTPGGLAREVRSALRAAAAGPAPAMRSPWRPPAAASAPPCYGARTP